MNYADLCKMWFDLEYAMRACHILGAPNLRLWWILQLQQCKVGALMVNYKRGPQDYQREE